MEAGRLVLSGEWSIAVVDHRKCTSSVDRAYSRGMSLPVDAEKVLAVLPDTGRINETTARAASGLDRSSFSAACNELVRLGLASRSSGALARTGKARDTAPTVSKPEARALGTSVVDRLTRSLTSPVG